jgi:hypothetical protein
MHKFNIKYKIRWYEACRSQSNCNKHNCQQNKQQFIMGTKMRARAFVGQGNDRRRRDGTLKFHLMR